MMNMNRIPPTSAPYGDASYTSTASPASGHFSTSGPSYDPMGYAPPAVRAPQFGMVGEAERSGKYPSPFVSPLTQSHLLYAFSVPQHLGPCPP